MAYTTIDKPSATAFNTKLYTGTRATTSITGVGFQPDFTWIKDRDNGNNQCWFDSVRGVNKVILSNATNAETTYANSLTAFNSDGYTIGSDTEGQMNVSGDAHASWNWKAGGTAVSNTDGSITSSASANATAGMSIVSFTGTGANATVGHGLSTAPKMIIFKNRPQAEGWIVYHQAISNTHFLTLNTSGVAVDNATMFNDTSPTSSVFSVGSNHGTNGTSHAMIAYCFADVQGYSKFSSYVGNGSSDGVFCYTGMKPSFVMIKATGLTENWWIMDSKRTPNNAVNKLLQANLSNAEVVDNANLPMDMLSNGFKTRGIDGAINSSGQTYIYMAFAEAPLVGTNNVPCTAR